ncbi:MAG: hypothetical protein V3V24_09890 [Nitrospinaceae bacterium]
MEKLTIELYSEKGLAVKGASESQALEIAAKLGKNVPATLSKPHGWVFSRKYEEKIRAIIETMNEET